MNKKSILHIECKQSEKADWVRAADGHKLADWVRETLNHAAMMQRDPCDLMREFVDMYDSKKAALDAMNKALGLRYTIQCLNSFLAGRKPVPKKIMDFICKKLLT